MRYLLLWLLLIPTLSLAADQCAFNCTCTLSTSDCNCTTDCIPPPVGAPVNTGNYTVVAGDSLSVIAKKFGVTVQQLMQWNALTSTNLKIGQKLITIAPTSTPVPPVIPPVVQNTALEGLCHAFQAGPCPTHQDSWNTIDVLQATGCCIESCPRTPGQCP